MKLENGEKYPCTVCENAGKNVNCFECVFGEFTEVITCHTYECVYNYENSCVVNAYERCMVRK